MPCSHFKMKALFFTSQGNGGGGDGSSGSEESGNDGGVSTVPLSGVQTTYDAFRGLGIVGSSPAGGHENSVLNNPLRHAQVRW